MVSIGGCACVFGGVGAAEAEAMVASATAALRENLDDGERGASWCELLELPRSATKRPRNNHGGGAAAAPATGAKAAASLLSELKAGGAVDEHLADQLPIFMALAEGESRLLCGPLSMHTHTAIQFARKLTGARIEVLEDLDEAGPEAGTSMIRCQGVGYVAARTVRVRNALSSATTYSRPPVPRTLLPWHEGEAVRFVVDPPSVQMTAGRLPAQVALRTTNVDH